MMGNSDSGMQGEGLWQLFYDYDWEKDPKYQAGLKTIYDSYFKNNINITKLEKENLIAKSKRFFFKRHHGVDINAEHYNEWINSTGRDCSKKLATVTATVATSANRSNESTMETIPSANQSNVEVATPALASFSQDDDNTKEQLGDKEQTILSYEELVELIMLGKPIPGIKKIPDIVLSEKASKSVLAPRLKPWEIARQNTNVDETV